MKPIYYIAVWSSLGLSLAIGIILAAARPRAKPKYITKNEAVIYSQRQLIGVHLVASNVVASQVDDLSGSDPVTYEKKIQLLISVIEGQQRQLSEIQKAKHE